jgi:hypothetical protein
MGKMSNVKAQGSNKVPISNVKPSAHRAGLAGHGSVKYFTLSDLTFIGHLTFVI